MMTDMPTHDEFQFHKGAIGVGICIISVGCQSVFQFHKGAIGLSLKLWLEN